MEPMMRWQKLTEKARSRLLFTPQGNPEAVQQAAQPLLRDARRSIRVRCGVCVAAILVVAASIVAMLFIGDHAGRALIFPAIYAMGTVGALLFGIYEWIMGALFLRSARIRIGAVLREIEVADDSVAIGTLLDLIEPIGPFFGGYSADTARLCEALTRRLLHAGADSLVELSGSQRRTLWRLALRRGYVQVAALTALQEIVERENESCAPPRGANRQLRRLEKQKYGEVSDPAESLLEARMRQ